MTKEGRKHRRRLRGFAFATKFTPRGAPNLAVRTPLTANAFPTTVPKGEICGAAESPIERKDAHIPGSLLRTLMGGVHALWEKL
jgi:hypothetical protein